jgi:hypothetical protein
MKKTFCILMLVLAFAGCTTSLYAHHWRVSTVPGASANYTSVQAAQSDPLVLPGDTLYLEPGGAVQSSFTWTKRLVIIGNGYYLAANPQTQANTGTSRFSYITIQSGASGSVLTGCDVGNTLTFSDNVFNIFIKRNKLSDISFSGLTGSNIFLLQNFLVSITSMGSTSWTNVSVENNIINQMTLQNGLNGTFLNNIFTNMVYAYNCTFANNIQTAGTFTPTGCTTYNNIGSSTQYGTSNGNMSNVNMNNVFVCFSSCTTYSDDGRYQLKSGSVAAGAGAGGIDCGIFAGNYPYVLSGMPGVPAIYYLQVLPQGDLLNVSVKVKSHN